MFEHIKNILGYPSFIYLATRILTGAKAGAQQDPTLHIGPALRLPLWGSLGDAWHL
jgi:hypothetical protein